MMDIMPDNGTYICHFARKRDLYDQYMLDIESDTSGTLVACRVNQFMTTLRERFNDIRLRKHCRFAKCEFCEKWKG